MGKNKYINYMRCIICLGFIFLILLNYIGFYDSEIKGNLMIILMIIRSFALGTIPLLFMTYGYVLSEEKLSFKYYFMIGRLVAYYLLLNGGYLLGEFLIDNQSFNLLENIKSIFSYDNIPMMWIVDVFFGMFCLMPMFNTCWNNADSKKERFQFLLVFFILTIMPSIFNVYGQIFPEHFISMYPIFFYFVGAWIKKYVDVTKIRREKKYVIFVICGCALVQNLSFMYNMKFNNEIYNDYGSWQSFFMGLGILFIVFSIKGRKNIVSKIAKIISDNMFAIIFYSFLILEIIDKILGNIEFKLVSVVAVYLVTVIFSIPFGIIINKIIIFLKKVLTHKKNGDNI